MVLPKQAQAQFEAADHMREDLERALKDGKKEYTIPPGVYRLRTDRPLVLEGTEGFTLNAAGVELLVSGQKQGHIRVLENCNLTVRGLLMDADPFGFTQGEIIDLNHDDLAITVQLFEGYPTVHDRKERIEFFTPEGVMLPHRQDVIQGFEELGGNVVRLKMSPFTWDQHAEHAEEILKPGNLLAIELGGNGGLEMRSNTNTTWEDVAMHSAGLTWCLPSFGEDRFVRWNGSRRRDTNRLVGGGYPLMTFKGGAYTLIDSELGHNFDDLTDINTCHTFAFQQIGPRQFHIMDSHAEQGWPITIHNYVTMNCDHECCIEALEDCRDPGMRDLFKQLAKKYNVRDLGDVKICTVDCDVQLPEFSYVSYIPCKTSVMRFERNYIHDGLSAGINAKGADQVIIKDNIVERSAGFGIAVGFDPFWCCPSALFYQAANAETQGSAGPSVAGLCRWEGNPSRNIEIVGNTVRSCSYAPGWDHSAIAVYVGGSFRGMPGPEADAQLNQGIVIANNAVYTSGAAAIAVTNSRDVVIADNVITDTNVGGFAAGSIFLNAVSAGTRVVGNVFVGTDASMEAAQIRTGRHNEASSIVLENNGAANPEVLVPDQPWHFHPATHPHVEVSGEGWWLDDWHPHARRATAKAESAATFRFQGTRVRVLGVRSQWTGLADVFIDNQFAGTIDNSRRSDEEIGCYYVSPILPEGDHRIKIVNRAQPGELGKGDRQAIAIHGFDVLAAGAGHYQWDPREGPLA